MEITPFNQPPPELGNQYDDDRLLRSYLKRALPADMLASIEDELRSAGELGGRELFQLSMEDRLNEPVLVQWDPWGNRIDRIDHTRVWQRSERIAAERGLVATAYERRHGALSRVHQFALVYLLTPSMDTYGCPLAMTDGAARSLLDSGNQALIDRALPHLTSRDPATFWTSGQWMTESTGGSDVAGTETVAREVDGRWELWGRKWFTSAATSQMALTLARPEGNPEGNRGLAMFYVEARDAEGRLRNIRINRLKDKLGTRKLPTAEIMLDGAPAELVSGTTGGVLAITPMLNTTRTWNGVTAAAGMRRGLALARDFAPRRVAFGAPLSEKPLHLDTMAGVQAELEGAFHLAFHVVELIGRHETGEASERDELLLRLLTPVMKLTTGKQAVGVASEVLESFGGAGYVEDTGLPVLLRDAQVLSIWEGTTNVLSLDTARVLMKEGVPQALSGEVEHLIAGISDAALVEAAEVAHGTVRRATEWLGEAARAGRPAVEAGARRLGISLGRALSLALLVRHAQWPLDHHNNDRRPRAAAIRYAQSGVDQLAWMDLEDARLLANDSAG